MANTGVKGVVRGLDGKPVDGGRVAVWKDGGDQIGRNMTTTSQGEFWKILLPGAYRIQAFVNDCVLSGQMPFRITTGKRLKVLKIVVRKKFNCRPTS